MLAAPDLAAFVHERLFATVIPRLRGRYSLLFASALHRGFSHGPGARCWGPLKVLMGKGSVIEIGRDLWVVSDSRRAGIALATATKITAMPGAQVVVGHQVALNGTSITARRRIEIGSGTMVAANVAIVDSDFHAQWPPERRQSEPGSHRDSPVVIGRNVWIGMGSLVLKGVSIGDDSIIGAGSVVTRSMPAGVMAAGVPARVIRPIGPDEPA